MQHWLVSFKIRGAVVDLEVYPKALKHTVTLLKTLSFFNYECLTEITVTDNLGKSRGNVKEGRFRITYTLSSVIHNSRVHLHSKVSTDISVETVSDLFSNAGWLEREVWDMFGLHFEGHTDLRRILTDYQFEGFPLRKDFPVIGFVELFYFDTEARIIYLPVALAQQMKQYSLVAGTT